MISDGQKVGHTVWVLVWPWTGHANQQELGLTPFVASIMCLICP